MKRKIRFSAWLIGGVCAGFICLILAFVLFIFQDETYFPTLFPILTFAIFNLAFRGTSPSVTTQIFIMIAGIRMQLLMYFGIGTIIGLIFQKAKNRYIKFGIVVLGILVIPGVMTKTYFAEQEWYNTTFHVGLTFEDCDKKLTMPDIANCYGDVYDKYPPSVEVCEKMMKGDIDYYGCSSYVGEKSGNIDLCKKLTDPQGVDSCIASIPRFSKNDLACGYLKNESSRDTCFYRAAVISKEYRYCEKMSSNKVSATTAKTDCILSIAMDKVFDCTDNSSEKYSCMKDICDSLSEKKAHSNCFLNIAFQLDDKSSCDYIRDQKDVQRCLALLKEYSSEIGRRAVIHGF
jgi:hypothetical protein